MDNQSIKERLKDFKMKPNTPYAYIPKQLIVADKPEYARFPMTVVFSSVREEADGSLTYGFAPYDPDFSLYRELDRGYGMSYWNRHGWNLGLTPPRNDWRLAIVWDEKRKLWIGVKFNGADVVQRAEAPEWKEFFIRLTSQGLANGEKCSFENESREMKITSEAVVEADVTVESLAKQPLGFQI